MRHTLRPLPSTLLLAAVMLALLLTRCGATPTQAPRSESQTSAPEPSPQALAATAAIEPTVPAIGQATDTPATPASQTLPATQTTGAIAGSAPATPILVKLHMSKAPKLDEEVEVTLEVQAFRDAPDTTAEIELPPEARVVRGDLRWAGDVRVGAPVKTTITIAFTRPGEYTVRGKAQKTVSPDMVWGDIDELYLTVKQDAGMFGFESSGDTQVSATAAPD